MTKEDLQKVSELDLLEELQERGFYVARTPQNQRGKTFKGDLTRWGGNTLKFGVVSDTHLGSKYQQLTHLASFYSLLARRKIKTVFHCGDLVDGEKMYRGQEYEIFVHGADAQMNYAVSFYPSRKGITTYAISGNHDQSFFKSAGYNIVKGICERRDDMVYMGDDVAMIEEGEVPIKIMLMHGRSGVPYARSYRIQKVVEQLSSENKPHFLFLGHYHVPNLTPGYRNVESVQMPCFQAQTPYLVAKGLQPSVGGVIVTVCTDKKGIAKVTYESVPFYESIKGDF